MSEQTAMSVTIRYRHPRRPDEAGIGYAPDDAYAAALIDRLVRRGYEIVEIVPAPAGDITNAGGAETS